MLAYPKLPAAAIAAGLDKITVSVHGHTAALHDELVVVPGAFEQAPRGAVSALASKRRVANIDILINAMNVGHLPDMLETFVGWGDPGRIQSATRKIARGCRTRGLGQRDPRAGDWRPWLSWDKFRKWFRERNAVSFEIHFRNWLVQAELEGKTYLKSLHQLEASNSEHTFPIAA